MAVVLGTNAGFVTVAPTADPGGNTTTTMDNNAWATKDTSPSGTITITEVGWWCNNATEEANFEVGLYSHYVAGDTPQTLLFSDTTNAKGTTAGWKSKAVNWSISASTIYWIAVQLDNTATATQIDVQSGGTGRSSYDAAVATLPASFSPSATYNNLPIAIYALYSSSVHYDEGTKTVTATGGTSLPVEELHWASGTLVVTGISSVSLAVEVYENLTVWPNERPSNYDPDLFWDEEDQEWNNDRLTMPGNRIEWLVVLGDEGEIYFRSL